MFKRLGVSLMALLIAIMASGSASAREGMDCSDLDPYFFYPDYPGSCSAPALAIMEDDCSDYLDDQGTAPQWYKENCQVCQVCCMPNGNNESTIWCEFADNEASCPQQCGL